MREEIWKDVPEYEGLYQASTLGRVKKLETKTKYTHKLRVYKEQIMTPNLNGGGYLKLGLRKNGKRTTIMVHLIIAMTFLDHKLGDRNIVINHINFIKLDNRPVNLEITTQRINTNRKHVKSSSKYTGVSWHNGKKKWCAQIRIDGNLKHLGQSSDELEASKLYEDALEEHLA